MKYRKIIIERIIFEDSTIEEREKFANDNEYGYKGTTYLCEAIYEKIKSKEQIDTKA